MLINLYFSHADCDTLLEKLFLVSNGLNNFQNDYVSMFILFTGTKRMEHIASNVLQSTWRLMDRLPPWLCSVDVCPLLLGRHS